MLHVLRAQNRRANLFREMEAIFKLAPKSRALEPLLMRELLELERDLLGQDVNPRKQQNSRHHRRPRRYAGKRLIELQGLVTQIVNAGTSARPDLWLFARATLEMLAGDHYHADVTFAELRQKSENDSILAQVDILQQVSDILALDAVNDDVEMEYYTLLKDDELRGRYPYLKPLVNDKLEKVYAQRGQPAKANLMRYGWDAIQQNPQITVADELLALSDSLTGNAFDRGLLRERIGETVESDLQHLKGLYYLQRGQWEIALKYFIKIPAARRDDYGTFAPFVKQFHDRVNYAPDPSLTRYNKVELLERLLALEDEARQSENDTVAARNYFNIGLAHYNLSYFSYNWQFADAFRSATSAARAARAYNPTSTFSHPDAPLGNLENFNMDRAAYYFERAFTRAPSREAAAEALYYAAKAARNQHYATGRPGGQRPFLHFTRLQNDYSRTRFYQHVVEECRTFAWFVDQ